MSLDQDFKNFTASEVFEYYGLPAQIIAQAKKAGLKFMLSEKSMVVVNSVTHEVIFKAPNPLPEQQWQDAMTEAAYKIGASLKESSSAVSPEFKPTLFNAPGASGNTIHVENYHINPLMQKGEVSGSVTGGTANLQQKPKEGNPVQSFENIVDTVLKTGKPLLAAVPGTSPGSVYHIVAMAHDQHLVLSARVRKQDMSYRLEGAGLSGLVKTRVEACGLLTLKEDRATGHFPRQGFKDQMLHAAILGHIAVEWSSALELFASIPET